MRRVVTLAWQALLAVGRLAGRAGLAHARQADARSGPSPWSSVACCSRRLLLSTHLSPLRFVQASISSAPAR